VDRLLANRLFSSSKRYPKLLKYIVDETLAGRSEQLKERTIGVGVFGRDPSYDTNLDPVVRRSAAEVRQRMAQYYLEPGHEGEVRIELLPGSYVPVFRNPGRIEDSAQDWTVPAADEPKRSRRFIPYAVAIGAGSIALMVAAFLLHTRWADPAQEFWGPVWDKSAPILICVPGKFPTPEDPTQTSGLPVPAHDPEKPLTIGESQRLNSIAWPDATGLYTLVGFIQARGQKYLVRRERNSSLSDLRNGPVILIGGFNNKWLMQLTSHYRFTYQADSTQGDYWISDTQNPSRSNWKVSGVSPYTSFDEDYGMICRVVDPTTERWVIVVSGIASYGTIAAAEFLTNPEYLELIAQKAPKGWQKKNLQVVFATKVFNGYAGRPRVLAIHVW
jgi:hypothetical protein